MVLAKLFNSFFILILLCFWMPFLSVSCDRKEVVKLTGFQLITGTEVNLGAEAEPIRPQWLAILAFGLAIAGVGTGVLKGSAAKWLGFLAGLGAGLALFFLKLNLADEVTKIPQLVFYVDYLPCYWIALGLCGVVTLANAAALICTPRLE